MRIYIQIEFIANKTSVEGSCPSVEELLGRTGMWRSRRGGGGGGSGGVGGENVERLEA